MVDDKKNIPDAGNAEAPLKQGETEPVKVDHPVQCQPGTAKTEVGIVKKTAHPTCPVMPPVLVLTATVSA